MKIAVVSSSNREKRNSHRVAIALENEIKKQGSDAVMVDLQSRPLPFFTERYSLLPESDKTSHMHSIAQDLQSSAAIIFVTPEYNGSISAALKNLIDTFGRPEFSKKPIAVATVSTGAMGGMRAAQQLQQTILALQAYPQPQMLLTGEVQNQLNENGEALNETYATKVENFVKALMEFAGRF